MLILDFSAGLKNYTISAITGTCILVDIS